MTDKFETGGPVSVEQWEKGRPLPDDIYEPKYAFSQQDLIYMSAGYMPVGRVTHYEGKSSGIKLSAEFCNVLE